MYSNTCSTTFTQQANIEFPIICGAMYPCSNPELIAAVSEAGGIGIIQPVSLTYVHEYTFEEGLKYIRSLTKKPIGMNLILEKSIKSYERRMMKWLEEALNSDVRFFVTALGKPKEVTRLIHQAGGIVYHDVTDEIWAKKALDSGVDGLICVNQRAGGHAGGLSAQTLYQTLSPLGLPLIAAGGIGDKRSFYTCLKQGYDGVQMGTRFIATHECTAHASYKKAIIEAKEEDIMLTDKISGIPCSVIRTPLTTHLDKPTGPIQKWLLQHHQTKKWMRAYFTLRSIKKLKKSSLNGLGYRDVFQAGKSVATINEVISAKEVIELFTHCYK